MQNLPCVVPVLSTAAFTDCLITGISVLQSRFKSAFRPFCSCLSFVKTTFCVLPAVSSASVVNYPHQLMAVNLESRLPFAFNADLSPDFLQLPVLP